MKSGWIYLFKLKSGEVHEGIFLSAFRGTYVWRPLYFATAMPCPRTCQEAEVEWAWPVVENTPTLCESGYMHALAKGAH